MDPDQTAPLGPHCLSMGLQIFSGRQKTYILRLYALGLINVSSVCIRLGFS